MKSRILVVNPPSYAVRPIVEQEYIYMAPYVLASDLKAKGVECQVFDFIAEKLELNGWGDNLRIDRVEKCGNFDNEFISKHVYFVGKRERNYVDYLKAYKPNEVWISVLYTYNWQAAQFVAGITREFNPLIKIRVGGTYVTLCPEHAKANIDADEFIISKHDDMRRFQNIDLTFYRDIPRTFPIQTSVGCPFNCGWCAVNVLEGNKVIFKDPYAVVDDLEEKYYYGVSNFRFLDSHLLANYDNHFKIIMQEIIKRKLKLILCSYGGINALFLKQEMLELMAQSGFKNLSIPLESIDEDVLRDNNRSVSLPQWEKAIKMIQKVKGFTVYTYVLCGMPSQDIKTIYRAINYARSLGVSAAPLFFTPIPQTRYEDKDIKLERLHPYLFPYASQKQTVKDMEQILVNYYNRENYAPDYIDGKESNKNNTIGEEHEIKINM